jgi:hypothetical protein
MNRLSHALNKNLRGDRLRIVPETAQIADIDGVAFAPLDCGGDGLAAKRRRDRLLQVADRETIAGEGRAVGRDFEVIAVLHALGVGAVGAGLSSRRAPVKASIQAIQRRWASFSFRARYENPLGIILGVGTAFLFRIGLARYFRVTTGLTSIP